MRNRYIAYGLILVNLIIQILGSLYYDQTPQVVWAFADGIQLLIPLVFGVRFGLLCFMPTVVSEIIWFCNLHSIGPLMHVVSFAVTIIILGMVGEKLKHSQFSMRVMGNIILYELSLLGEEALYYGLRMLFMHRPITWANVSGTFLSWANPILFLLLLYCFISDWRTDKER